MKKTSKRNRREPDELRPEYRFNYSKAKPNRFAAGMKSSTVAVVLDPDVASVFQTSEAVNALLRSVIAALPNDINTAAKSR
jgi:hypothetical protein